MALTVKALERKFLFEKDDEDINLPEINKELTPQQVMDYYSSHYSELTTATIDGPKVNGDVVEYRFVTKLGTKG